jgi:class 3 adenylate cyclase
MSDHDHDHDHDHVDVTVIAMDIEGSSRHESVGQAELYQELQRLFRAASDEIRLVLDPADIADRGDGNLVVVRTGYPLARLVADLPRELAGQLDLFNRNRRAEARLRIRMALQRGPVTERAGRWDGRAIVDAGRITESRALRELLATHHDATLALGISHAVFDATVRERLRYLDPDRWAGFEIGAKEKGAGIRAWARLLGQGAPETTPAPSPPAPAPRAHGDRIVKASKGPFTLGDNSPAIGTVHGNVGGHG